LGDFGATEGCTTNKSESSAANCFGAPAAFWSMRSKGSMCTINTNDTRIERINVQE